ncbi:MAG: 2',5' RNA ligase family [Alphaproteobacteria bacterium ADurb.Bin438]|nr:MAG: 2',5' RNA ligase family [Alphaproteobacteria bacterium ADurb.Bin438]
MIRLFVGLDIPNDVRDHVYSLRGGIPNTRWIDKENYHLVLRFIGNVTEDDAYRVHQELETVKYDSFNLALTTLGTFKTGSYLRNMWLGVNNFHVLDGLNDKVEKAVSRAGIAKDVRKFHAHVKVAKFNNANPEKVNEYIMYNNLFKSRDFKVCYFCLFSSNPNKDGNGSFFKVERSYPLLNPF